MSKAKRVTTKLAAFVTCFLSAVLFVNANSASSIVIHQEKAPAELKRFSRIK